MDFLNKAFAQLADLFKSMTLGARITAGLLLAVVVISLGYLFQYHVSGPDVDLMMGEPVPYSQLPMMQAAFAKAGLKSYRIEGTRILVPPGEQGTYMAALADNDALPPNIDTIIDDMAKTESPWISKDQREQRAKIAKQRRVGLMISEMKGIEVARVQYDTETKRDFNRTRLTTALVTVKPEGSKELSETQVASIRHAVAAAFAGMKAENVTVADRNGYTYYGSPESGGSSLDDPYATRKRMYEQDWKARILYALSYVPGVNVSLNVELDRERNTRTESVKHGTKPVPLWVEEKTATESEEGGSAAGVPGFEAQGNTPRALASASQGRGTKGEKEKSESQQQNVVDGERSVKDTVGLTPERVTVSVGVPASYFESVWSERNPTEAGQESKKPDQAALEQIQTEVVAKIQKHVAALLPPVADVADPIDLVTVTTFEDVKLPEIPPPGMAETALTWFGQYWGTLGMITLAMFSLIILRSMLRAGTAESETESRPSAVFSMESAEAVDESEIKAAAKRLGRFSGKGPSLRDELSELVKEDPDAAANILRTWIGSAS